VDDVSGLNASFLAFLASRNALFGFRISATISHNHAIAGTLSSALLCCGVIDNEILFLNNNKNASLALRRSCFDLMHIS
jgi:hypothetical protein